MLMPMQVHDAAIRAVRDEVEDLPIPLALTECHFALREEALPGDGRITFPAASVSAVEVDVRRSADG